MANSNTKIFFSDGDASPTPFNSLRKGKGKYGYNEEMVAAAAAGAWKGAGEAGAGFGTKFNMAAGAGFKQTTSAFSSGIKDHASRLLTGKESSSHNASSLHVGVGSANVLGLTSDNADKSGNVTNKSITEAYSKQAKQEAQKIEEEKAKKQNPPSDNSEQQAGKVNIAGNEQSSDLG